jgi:hypothetical protein
MTGPLRDPQTVTAADDRHGNGGSEPFGRRVTAARGARRPAGAALVVALLCALAGCGVSHAAGNASGVVAPSPRVGQVVNQALPVSIRTMPL